MTTIIPHQAIGLLLWLIAGFLTGRFCARLADHIGRRRQQAQDDAAEEASREHNDFPEMPAK